METKIYKIDMGLNGRNFKDKPKVNSPLGRNKSSFYSISNFKRGLEDFFLEGNLYFIDSQESLDTFRNLLGNQWIGGKQYYLSHPKNETFLIEARAFHEYIFMEQIGEIATYLHKNLHCNKVFVNIKEGNDFSSFKELNIEEDKLSEFGRVTLIDFKSLELTFYGDEEENLKNNMDDSYEYKSSKSNKDGVYEEHNLKSNKEDSHKGRKAKNTYFWIDDFKELATKLSKQEKKEFSYTLNLDNSFGISGKIAKKIGINPSWLNKMVIEFKIK